MPDPTASVIMPVRNGRKFVSEAIASVLQQFGPDDEVVVVDDHSIDGTPEVVGARFPMVRLLVNRSRGVSAARNTGIAAARGELIAFLDHDDWWPAGRHEVLKRALVENPDKNASFGRMRVRMESAAPPRALPPDGMLSAQHICTGLYRRELILSTDGFDDGLAFSEDADFHFQLVDAGLKPMLCDVDALVYRFHDNNTTSGVTQPSEEVSVLDCLRRHMLRRRRREANAAILPEQPNGELP